MYRIVFHVLLLFFHTVGYAGVNLRNGNFYITYPCDSLCGQLDRTYNSKAVERGWYGFGWGSLFETRLMVMTDISAVVLENGTGATTFYGKAHQTALADGIEQLITNVRAIQKLDTVEVSELRARLQNKDERYALARRYGMGRDLADDALLRAEGCTNGNLVRQGVNYVRTRCDGGQDTFNSKGWLMRREDNDGQNVELVYGKTPYPIQIKSSKGCVTDLEWNKAGAITSITTRKDDRASSYEYEYDMHGNLVSDTSADGSILKFSYDTQHNLTAISYPDTTKLSISYDEHSLTTAIEERTGEKTRYEYGGEINGQGEYWTKVTTIGDNGEPAEPREYRWSASNKPLRSYKHGDRIEYEYDPVNDKIIRYRTPSRDTSFEYDTRARLSHVSERGGVKDIWLVIDEQELIREIKHRDGLRSLIHTLTFDYNKNKKPTLIRLNGRESIRIKYTDAGEIDDVFSTAGEKSAHKITQMIMSLNAIFDVDGLDISF